MLSGIERQIPVLKVVRLNRTGVTQQKGGYHHGVPLFSLSSCKVNSNVLLPSFLSEE